MSDDPMTAEGKTPEPNEGGLTSGEITPQPAENPTTAEEKAPQSAEENAPPAENAATSDEKTPQPAEKALVSGENTSQPAEKASVSGDKTPQLAEKALVSSEKTPTAAETPGAGHSGQTVSGEPTLSPDSLFWAPLNYGWVRELVYRNSLGPNNKKADAYYKSPAGKKYRSLKEIERAMAEGKPGFDGLRVENFTYNQYPLGVNDPSREVIRGADPTRQFPTTKRSFEAGETDSPAKKKPKTLLAKPKMSATPPSKTKKVTAPPKTFSRPTIVGPALTYSPLTTVSTPIRSYPQQTTIVGARAMGYGSGIRPVPTNLLMNPRRTLQNVPAKRFTVPPSPGKSAEEIVCEPAIYGMGKSPEKSTTSTRPQALQKATTRMYQKPSDDSESAQPKAMTGLMALAAKFGILPSGKGDDSPMSSNVKRDARTTRGTKLALGEAKTRLNMSQQDEQPEKSKTPEENSEQESSASEGNEDDEDSDEETDENTQNSSGLTRSSRTSSMIPEHSSAIAKRLASDEAKARLVATREAEESSGEDNTGSDEICRGGIGLSLMRPFTEDARPSPRYSLSSDTTIRMKTNRTKKPRRTTDQICLLDAAKTESKMISGAKESSEEEVIDTRPRMTTGSKPKMNADQLCLLEAARTESKISHGSEESSEEDRDKGADPDTRPRKRTTGSKPKRNADQLCLLEAARTESKISHGSDESSEEDRDKEADPDTRPRKRSTGSKHKRNADQLCLLEAARTQSKISRGSQKSSEEDRDKEAKLDTRPRKRTTGSKPRINTDRVCLLEAVRAESKIISGSEGSIEEDIHDSKRKGRNYSEDGSKDGLKDDTEKEDGGKHSQEDGEDTENEEDTHEKENESKRRHRIKGEEYCEGSGSNNGTSVRSSNSNLKTLIDLKEPRSAFDKVIFELNKLVLPLGQDPIPWDEQKQMGLDMMEYIHGLSLIISKQPLKPEAKSAKS